MYSFTLACKPLFTAFLANIFIRDSLTRGLFCAMHSSRAWGWSSSFPPVRQIIWLEVENSSSNTFPMKSKYSDGEVQGYTGTLGRSTKQPRRQVPRLPGGKEASWEAKDGCEGESLWESPRQEKSNVKICWHTCLLQSDVWNKKYRGNQILPFSSAIIILHHYKINMLLIFHKVNLLNMNTNFL